MTNEDMRVLRVGAKELLDRTITEIEYEKIIFFLELLKKWNSVFNLTSLRDDDLIVRQHFLDCLSIVRILDSLKSDYVLDVGSGAGFPGLVIAIVRSEWQVCLVESCRKKTAFLNQAVSQLNLKNVNIFNSKIENLLVHIDFFDRNKKKTPIIVCRGFSSLKKFFELTSFFSNADCTWVAMKGKDPTKEIAELEDNNLCFNTIKINVPFLDATRHIVVFKNKVLKRNSSLC